MGDFEDHFKMGKLVGLLAAVVGGLLILDRGGSIGEATIVAASVGSVLVVGSLLPDIDHQASKPRQAVGSLGALAVIGAVIGLLVFTPDTVVLLGKIMSSLGFGGGQYTLGASILVIGAAVLLATGGDTFDSLTTHRGFTHSLPFVVLVGFGTLIASQQLANLGGILRIFQGQNGILLAVAAAAGVLVHIIVDR